MSLADYTNFRLIGKGSFGIVQTATKNPYTVVIKLILLDEIAGDPKLLAAAKNEASALARCSHPNIVRVFNAFLDKTSNQLCIEMEFCAGGDLSRVITEQRSANKNLAEAVCKDWLAQMALAIAYIHDQNIIHRDIKPKNIFLSADRKIVKLGDFGIVKFLDKAGMAAHAASSTMIGTATHMPPEVLRNVQGQQMVIDYKYDVWSLGVVFFEVLTFQLPFQISNANIAFSQAYDAIKRYKLPPIPASYSAEMRNIVARLLTVDLKKRPTMAEVCNDSFLHANILAHSEQIVADDWTQLLKKEVSGLQEELEDLKAKLQDEAKIRNELSAARARLEFELREARDKYRDLKTSLKNGSTVADDDDDDEEVGGNSLTTPELSIEEKKKLMYGLFEAIQKRSARDVVRMLEKGADINSKDSLGASALIRAANQGRVDMTELLLDKGASIDMKNNEGWTALMAAASQGLLDVAKLLIDRGANVNVKTASGETSLMKAAERGFTEMAELLLDNGAEVNARNKDGKTALHMAARFGLADFVKLLCQRQADMNVRNVNGKTALMYAAAEGRDEIVQILLAEGAEIDLRDNDGRTALVIACQYAKIEAVKILISEGADVNAKDNKKRYPSYYAKNDDIRRVIIASGGK